MKTKVLPACVPEYVESERDSMGREREFGSILSRGNPPDLLRVLVAQAPRGVRPAANRIPPGTLSPSRARAPQQHASAYGRHCEAHLVHLMNCFCESRPAVEEHLPAIILATENLLLAGLSPATLTFFWFEHPKTWGTHDHGGLLRTLLPTGQPYAPRLAPELVRCFDRLISRHFGYTDPVDPRGHRVAYVAWGSTGPANSAEIAALPQLATAWWHSQPKSQSAHQEFLQELAKQFRILAAPNAAGLPELREPSLLSAAKIPLLPNTVVVLSWDGRRAICLKGPACCRHFNPEDFARHLAWGAQEVAALQADGTVLFAYFQTLLQQRISHQRQFWSGPDSERVTLAAFDFLAEKLQLAQRDPNFWSHPGAEDLVTLDLPAQLAPFDFPADPSILRSADLTSLPTGSLPALIAEAFEFAAVAEAIEDDPSQEDAAATATEPEPPAAPAQPELRIAPAASALPSEFPPLGNESVQPPPNPASVPLPETPGATPGSPDQWRHAESATGSFFQPSSGPGELGREPWGAKSSPGGKRHRN